MRRRYKWLLGIVLVLGAGIGVVVYKAEALARNVEPLVRDRVVEYLSEHFDAEVHLDELHLRLPRLSPMKLWMTRGTGIVAGVSGKGLVIRRKGRPFEPALVGAKNFAFTVDLSAIYQDRRHVQLVTVDGFELHVPPRNPKPKKKPDDVSPSAPPPEPSPVVIDEMRITDALVVLHPRDADKKPLRFAIQKLRLLGAATDQPMRYEATLTNPKPPGQIESKGQFGPWNRDDPGDSALKGTYVFQNADLGVFKAIAGILQSTGKFEGVLSAVQAHGEARVPDFRLKAAGNPVPLKTEFDVLVDGTNGDTVLKPVRAQLGSSHFVTSGSVIKHTGDPQRTLTFDVKMPAGHVEDFLKLAMKGPDPFLTGVLNLNTKIQIPPLSGKVVEKLRLQGTFQVKDGKFLRSKIQDKLDELSRKGQGQPSNQEIDEVVSHMSGAFQLEDQSMTFSKLAFGVPGADIDLSGTYAMDQETLDFRGNLRLQAKLSQTQTGVKRWVLRPVDPFFSKNGSGTFVKIKISGDRSAPAFGLDY